MSGRRVNFGLWYDFRNPPEAGRSFESLYRASLEQITWAEALGFDSIWLTEHHFCADGYTPSPLVIAGAIGSCTRRLRIGTNLMLLPLADPVRLAEDAATLAILTCGRFDLGVGLGYRQLEFDHFGRKLSHRRQLMEEGIAILRQAFSGAPVHFHGKHFTVDGLSITPTPAEPPRLFLGGMAPPAIERAARLGDGFLSTGGLGHDEYIAALARLGKPRASGRIMAGHWGIIARDPEAEAARVAPHVLYQANQYIDWGAFGPRDQVPPFPDAATAIRDGLYELHDATSAIASLTALLDRYPEIEDVHFWAQFPGEPVERGSVRIEYIAREVLPAVRRHLSARTGSA